MTIWLRRSCVFSWAFQAQQQQLTNSLAYGSSQVRTSSSTSTSTEIFTCGAQRNYLKRRPTNSPSASFCSLLQDPTGRKLCKKLWDEKESHKMSKLQKCFDEATWAYKWYRETEHRRDLEVLESTVEINEATYQQKLNCGQQHSNNYCNNRSNSQGFKNNSSFNGIERKQQQPKGPVQILLWTQRSSRFDSCWKKMQTNLNNTQRQNCQTLWRIGPENLHTSMELNLEP